MRLHNGLTYGESSVGGEKYDIFGSTFLDPGFLKFKPTTSGRGDKTSSQEKPKLKPVPMSGPDSTSKKPEPKVDQKDDHKVLSLSSSRALPPAQSLPQVFPISPFESWIPELNADSQSTQNVPFETPVLQTVDDFENIDALLDPAVYFAELDDLEMEIAEKCHVQAIFPQPTVSRHIQKSEGLYSSSRKIDETSVHLARAHCRTVLYGILAALELLKTRGLCGDAINILVQDVDRPNVIRTVDVPIADIRELSLNLELESATELETTARLALDILDLFGAESRVPVMGAGQPTVGDAICLLCSLLSLGTVAYAGSHCQDIGQTIWSAPLDSITFDNACTGSGRPFRFCKQQLACLNDFIGGPVWVFGGSDSTESLLSTSIEQFAGLWGPILAVPSEKGFEEVLTIQSESGLMFKTNDADLAGILTKDEILVHWISCEPPRKKRKDLLSRIFTSSRKGERLPDKLIPFPANAQLLIGHPPSGASCTITNAPHGLTLNPHSGLRVNNYCKLDLNKFAEDNAARLHLIGTWDESYVPDQLQVALSAGQYVNVGLQKVWKRRPACTLKSRLLLAFSNPRVRAENIRELLKMSVGLEQSACTGNAKRITLEQALCCAYPSEAPTIERLCQAGNAQQLLEFVVELGFTGLDSKGALSLFWPFSGGQDALEVTDPKPMWKDLLRDTRDNACFAVISPCCLTYAGRDDAKSRSIRMLCSCRLGNSARPVFQTAINLDPKAEASLPLEREARIRVADGFLEIRNIDAGAQLAVYGRRGLLSMIEEVAICAREGQRGHQHREMVAAQRASRNTVRVCIMDR